MFYHIQMGHYVHDALNKVVIYYTLNWIFKNEHFLVWSFFKMKHRICTKHAHFYKFIFITKWWRKKCDLLGKVISSWNNIHKWHMVTCSHEIDGCKIQEFY
jgi:hypothetical protein